MFTVNSQKQQVEESMMAQYAIIYKANGIVLHELRFMGEEFSYEISPTASVFPGGKIAYDIRLEKCFPNLTKNTLMLLRDMACSENAALKAIKALTQYEKRHGWIDDD
jgi:hypothetical protein